MASTTLDHIRRPLRGALITLAVATLVACGGQVAQPTPPPDEDRARVSVDSAPQAPEPVTVTGARTDKDDHSNADAAGAATDSIVATENLLQLAGQARLQKLNRNAASPAAQMSVSAFSSSYRQADEALDRENYAHLAENGIRLVQTLPVSTFSIDVDTGAYSNMRRILNEGRLPPAHAVRVEELINYFSYAYAQPNNQRQPFSVSTEVAATPWNPDSLLLQIGIKGYEIPADSRPASNLVFLIDVSGSMQSANKLPLLKSAFRLLTENLNARDSVAMVVYAGASGVVLAPTPGDNGPAILGALEELRAGGSTNGAAGIRLAYDVAREAFIEDGINRVILATDGDFNVGTVNFEALVDIVERERETGVSLTTLGFGSGNYNDKLMEQLADAGNGNYAYVDNLSEARKVLVDEMGATLQTIAKDVKIQVEFNPQHIAEYRLIGYENRVLNREDFNNDKVDAGEIGAGHTVTALYELTPVGSKARLVDALRYGNERHAKESKKDELAFVRLRYKAPDEDTSKLIEYPVRRKDIVKPMDTSDDFRFAASVAAFGQQLRHGRFTGDYALDETLALAGSALGDDRYGYRREFLSLVTTARALSPEGSVQISDRGTER